MIRVLLFLLLFLNPANAQLAGGLQFPGPGISIASYQGPGDVVGSATSFYSCARAYNLAYANGTNPLCDLVNSSTGAVAVCTLRVLATGFVDLTGNYCVGSTTPAVACAAALGGACSVSKIYDQVGTNHLTNATHSQRPILTFASLNSLPGITCSNAGVSILSFTPLTLAQPVSFATVYTRTANPTNATLILGINGSPTVRPAASANLARAEVGSTAGIDAAATDNSYHAVQAVLNNTSSVVVVDGGTATTGTTAAGGFSASQLRFCRNGASLDGTVMEAGMWPVAFNATQYGNLNTNQHGINGYNF